MPNCSIITYRLKRNVQPPAVLTALYDLLSKYDLSHARCLWSLSSFSKNSILKIRQDYPQIAQSFQHIQEDNRAEIYRLTNYQQPGFISAFPDQEAILRDIICKIPTSYHVNSLMYLMDGVSFSEPQAIRENPIGPPTGSYIAYSREVSGDERHAYILLAAEYSTEKQPELFRDFFLELSKMLPGTYEGTEIIFD